MELPPLNVSIPSTIPRFYWGWAFGWFWFDFGENSIFLGGSSSDPCNAMVWLSHGSQWRLVDEECLDLKISIVITLLWWWKLQRWWPCGCPRPSWAAGRRHQQTHRHPCLKPGHCYCYCYCWSLGIVIIALVMMMNFSFDLIHVQVLFQVLQVISNVHTKVNIVLFCENNVYVLSYCCKWKKKR